MLNLDELTVLNDLRARFRDITPEQVAAASRKFGKRRKSDKSIGIVANESTQALRALALSLQSEQIAQLAQALGDTNEVIERDHKEQAHLLDILGDVARELFYAQAKLDLGFHQQGSVEVRENWEMVKISESGPQGFLGALLGMSDANE